MGELREERLVRLAVLTVPNRKDKAHGNTGADGGHDEEDRPIPATEAHVGRNQHTSGFNERSPNGHRPPPTRRGRGRRPPPGSPRANHRK